MCAVEVADQGDDLVVSALDSAGVADVGFDLHSAMANRSVIPNTLYLHSAVLQN